MHARFCKFIQKLNWLTHKLTFWFYKCTFIFFFNLPENKSLRLRLQSFLSGKDETGKILSNAEKTQCAIALLHSLPCARHAVLEQLCDVFHEAVQKYMVELERQALSGTFFFYVCLHICLQLCTPWDNTADFSVVVEFQILT